MVVKVTYNDLAPAIQKQLEGYEVALMGDINKAIKKTAEWGADQLHTARAYHDRTGAYSQSWKAKPDGYNKENSKFMTEKYKIYNEKHYRLTHLLEKGHVGRNGKRVSAYEHIRPVEDLVMQLALSEVQRVIRENAN